MYGFRTLALVAVTTNRIRAKQNFIQTGRDFVLWQLRQRELESNKIIFKPAGSLYCDSRDKENENQTKLYVNRQGFRILALVAVTTKRIRAKRNYI